MATKIVTKNSSTASAVPTASDLVQGELAVNVADKRLFTEDNGGSIIELGTNPSTIDINAGSIDGTAIGASSASTGAFTTLTATGIDVTGTVTADGLTVATSNDPASITLRQTGNTSGFILKNFDDNEAQLVNVDNGPMVFKTNDTEAMRIDSSGNVGIGSSSPSNKMSITGYNEMTLGFPAVSGGASRSGIKPTVTGAGAGQLEFLVGGDNNNEATTVGMAIDSSGNVGIGTSSPSYELDIQSSSGDAEVAITGSTTNNAVLKFENVTSNTLADIYADNSKNLIFRTNSTTERMRIDSSGNLLVGKTSANTSAVGVEARENGLLVATRSGGQPLLVDRLTDDGNLVLFRKDGTTVGSVGTRASQLSIGSADTGLEFNNANDNILPLNTSTNSGRDAAIDLGASGIRFKSLYLSGDVVLGASDGYIFGNTNGVNIRASSGKSTIFDTAGSERMRIDSSGNLLVSTTNFGGTINCERNGNTYNYHAITDANNTTEGFFRGYSSAAGGNRIIIYSNGNIVNSNNSYGALSDLKLKENITDVTPKLDKLNQVRVVNYNLKGEDLKQIGVIAQEIEDVFPSIVTESPDQDENGTDLGTTTKSVKYSVFVPMLIKAIQEQQTLIESLTARIAALEE